MELLRVVLADPYHLIRIALSNLLANTKGIEVVGGASEGRCLLRLVHRVVPDVVLIEPLIANPTGVEVTKCIEASEIPTRVLAISQCEHRWVARRMLEAGAYGYLTKHEDVNVLLDSLHSVAAGKDGLVSESVSEKLLSRHSADVERARRLLTEREWEVMHFVAEGLSSREIGEAIHLSPGTVRNHVSHILQKLDISSRLKLMVWVHRNDLLHFWSSRDTAKE